MKPTKLTDYEGMTFGDLVPCDGAIFGVPDGDCVKWEHRQVSRQQTVRDYLSQNPDVVLIRRRKQSPPPESAPSHNKGEAK